VDVGESFTKIDHLWPARNAPDFVEQRRLSAGRRRWSNCREVLSRHHWAHSRSAADITKHGNRLTGSYEYGSRRKSIELRGHILSSGDYEIGELDAHGQTTAKFTVNDLFGRSLNGTWQSWKRRLPSLKARSAGSHQRFRSDWQPSNALSSGREDCIRDCRSNRRHGSFAKAARCMV
jgi:hypothetical protein